MPTVKNKYNAKKVIGHDGKMFDSKKEAKYAATLEMLKKSSDSATKVCTVERQVVYELIPAQRDAAGKSIERACTYKLDFRVTYADGHVEYVDVKGMKTEVYRIKKKLMLHVHGIRIKEV